MEKRLIYSRIVLLLTGFVILFNCCAALLGSERINSYDQNGPHFSLQKDSSSSILISDNEQAVDLEEIETGSEKDSETEQCAAPLNDSHDHFVIEELDCANSTRSDRGFITPKHPLYLLNENFRI